MSWIYLLLAILLEVLGTTCMKLSEGLAKLVPSLLMVLFYAGSFALMALALKRLDVGTAYAVWSGLGTAFIAVVGFVWFAEPVTMLKLASLGCVIAGVVGLRIAAG